MITVRETIPLEDGRVIDRILLKNDEEMLLMVISLAPTTGVLRQPDCSIQIDDETLLQAAMAYSRGKTDAFISLQKTDRGSRPSLQNK